jgi:hypothetical protein
MKSVIGKSLVLVVFISLFGCSHKKTNSNYEAIKNTGREFGLMDTWESKCEASKLLGLSMKNYYNFSGNDFIKVTEFSNNSNCSDPSLSVQYKGSFKLADKSERLVDARNIDFDYQMANLKAQTKESVKLLNSIHFCGKDNYVVDEKHNLTNESDDNICPLANIPFKRYDLMMVKDKKLFFGVGDEVKMVNVKDRPYDLDLENPLVISSKKLQVE